jgi:aryl-alcohol dehydrogenase-like predicted oxidoreductase
MRKVFGSKLLLGGANFGNTYGVTNTRNPDNSEVGEIVRDALSSAFLGVDTAPAYGDSETVLGDQELDGKEVFTKISSKHLSFGLDDAIKNVEASINRLRVKKLSGLTFHSSDDFLGNPSQSMDLINSLLDMELIESWGVSLYLPIEIEKILESGCPGYIQAPVNIVDRRFLDEGVVKLLAENRVNLQARSLFLQGILLETPAKLPQYFSPWIETLAKYHMISRSLGASVLSLSLCAVLQNEYIHRAVVGVNSKSQLFEILSAINTDNPIFDFNAIPNCDDEALIDPRNWTR